MYFPCLHVEVCVTALCCVLPGVQHRIGCLRWISTSLERTARWSYSRCVITYSCTWYLRCVGCQITITSMLGTELSYMLSYLSPHYFDNHDINIVWCHFTWSFGMQLKCYGMLCHVMMNTIWMIETEVNGLNNPLFIAFPFSLFQKSFSFSYFYFFIFTHLKSATMPCHVVIVFVSKGMSWNLLWTWSKPRLNPVSTKPW